MKSNDSTVNIHLSFDGCRRIIINNEHYDKYILELQKSGEINCEFFKPSFTQGKITKIYDDLQIGRHFRFNYLSCGVIRYEEIEQIRTIELQS